jgi:hypothetical protein
VCYQNDSSQQSSNFDPKASPAQFDDKKTVYIQDEYVVELEYLPQVTIFVLVKNYAVTEDYEVLCHYYNRELKHI